MTVATLLAHVGIDVPRYVTVGGQIVLDPAVAATTSPLRIEPHRFHAGVDPARVRKRFGAAWWNTDLVARAADESAMRTYFPNFTLHGSEQDDYLWSGTFNTGRGSFSILVLPQVNHSLPSVIPMKKNLGRPEGFGMQIPRPVYC